MEGARGSRGVGRLDARAYAKVNLCLAVAPPELPGTPKAGWHRIASWFACVDLWDDVHLRFAEGAGPLHSTYTRRWADDAPRPSPIDWPIEKDLAWRAHRLLEQHVGRALPVHLELVKRIPTGGGLGGGSSDAAAVLVALTVLFDLPVSAGELRALSARLGSDIAYFIPDRPRPWRAQTLVAAPPSAIVRGFGDIIEPAAAISGPLTLILPGTGCPTPAVYKAFDARLAAGVHHEFREGDIRRMATPSPDGRHVDTESRALDLFNDLTDPAVAVEPEVGRAAQALRNAGHTPHLSGSGSTLFVLGDAPVAPPPGCALVRTRFV